jgi:hypothetical protein
MGGAFMKLGAQILMNPIFLLVAVIIAIVAAIVLVMQKFGVLQTVIDALMMPVNALIKGFEMLTDWMGLTDNAGEEYAANELARMDAQAIAGGAFGGAREGIQKAEYGAQTLQDRSALQAQLLQQGYGQAQQQANTAFQQQQGLASLQPQLLGSQIGAMSALGQQQQAQQQAILDAQATAAREAAFEPYTRYGLVGQQLTGLVGGFPTQVQTFNPQQPTSPLQTALGTGLGLASIGGKVFGKGGIFG